MKRDYQSAVEYVEFMKKLGAAYMNLQGVMWEEAPNLRPTNRERILAYAALSNRIGKLCADNGIKACFHPHANTPVFTPEQIDLFLENTDPSLVHLCLDTGHTVLAGMDVVTAVKRYLPRIGYMHLKDVDPDKGAFPDWPMDRFLPLGMGTVDFRGVYKALQEGGYDGILLRGAGQPARVRLPRRHGFPQLPAQRPRAVSRGSRLAAGAPPQGRPSRRRSAKNCPDPPSIRGNFCVDGLCRRTGRAALPGWGRFARFPSAAGFAQDQLVGQENGLGREVAGLHLPEQQLRGVRAPTPAPGGRRWTPWGKTPWRSANCQSRSRPAPRPRARPGARRSSPRRRRRCRTCRGSP